MTIRTRLWMCPKCQERTALLLAGTLNLAPRSSVCTGRITTIKNCTVRPNSEIGKVALPPERKQDEPVLRCNAACDYRTCIPNTTSWCSGSQVRLCGGDHHIRVM